MSATIADASGYLTTLGFIRMDGVVRASGPMMKDISQEGVAGAAFQRYAYRGEPFPIRTTAAFTFPADVASAQILYAQYQTRNVNITDDFGNTFSNVMVLSARVVDVRKIASGVGLLSAKNYLVTAEWELQSVAVGY